MKVKNILISQNAPAEFDKSPYADLTRKYSINIDFFKFFRIEGIPSREFREAHINILDHSAVVFSSKTTVDYFFSLVKELRCELPEELRGPEVLRRREPDYAKIAELCRRFEFNKILRDLPAPAPSPAPEPADDLPLFTAAPAPEKAEKAPEKPETFEQGSLF